MRIKDIHVEGYGVWRDLDIADLADDMTVFYGPNEAGKTTLMQFIRGVLYGFCGSQGRYLPPVHGGKPGGRLTLNDQGRRYVTHRRALVEEPGHEGRVTVTYADGGSTTRTVRELLSGVDESIFSNVFALGLREIQELNTLDGTEAAQQLYAMTSGIDRVSLMEVMGELEQARERILDDGEHPSEVSRLLTQRERLRQRRDELLTQGREWLETTQRRGVVAESPEVLERTATDAAAQARVLEIAIHLHPQWQECIKLDRAIQDDNDRVHVSSRTLQRVEQLKSEILALRKKLGSIRRKRARIRKEASALEFHRTILDHAERIQAALEEGQRIPALEQQVQHLQAEIEEQKVQLQQKVVRQMESSVPGGASALASWKGALQPVTGHTLSALRVPARAVRAATQAVRREKEELEKMQRDSQRHAERLEKVLGPSGREAFSQSLAEAGQQVERVRRRIQIEERLHQMLRRRDEVEEDIVDLMQDDVMPFSRLMWTGVPFVIGFTLLLSGLFWPEITPLGGFVSVLGMGGLLFGMLTKVMLERQAASELEDCNRQLAGLNHDIEELESERDQLDRLLPKGGGPLDVRLREMETRFEQLQQLAPIESDLQLADHRTVATQERLEEGLRELKIARRRWRIALKKQKLPESMKPSQIRELAEGSEETMMTQQQIESRRADLEARQRELQSWAQRLEQLIYDVQLSPASRDPKSQMKQLAGALAEQRKLQDRRAQFKREYDVLKRHGLKLLKDVRKLRVALQSIFRDHQVEDEDQLRHAADYDQRMEDLRQKREQLGKSMEESVEDASLIAPVFQELKDSALAQLEHRWERCQQREQEARGRLQALKNQESEVRDEIHGLIDDYRLSEVQFDLASIEEQLRQAIRQWRVLAVTQTLLRKIRDDYENDRQPQTLSDASEYLRRLTGGRYVRVWTPFGEPTLRIDDAQGENVSVDVLSCGTREAVFVSLRLALAEEYARRGAVLPMILDDVLVNLDNHRVQLAVEVLRDFSRSGHQILLFTCHDHVRELFREAGVETRALPARDGAAEPANAALAPALHLQPSTPLAANPLPPAPEPEAEPPVPTEPEPAVKPALRPAPIAEPPAPAVIIQQSSKELREEQREAEEPPPVPEPSIPLDEQPVRVEYIAASAPAEHPRQRKRRRRPEGLRRGDPYEFERFSTARETAGDRQYFAADQNEHELADLWFHEPLPLAPAAGPTRERPLHQLKRVNDTAEAPDFGENWWAKEDSAIV